MVTKNKVIEFVEQMPETFPIDDLVERVLIHHARLMSNNPAFNDEE